MNTFDVIVIFLLFNVGAERRHRQRHLPDRRADRAVTLVTVNAAVDRLIASSTTAARIFDGRATTVISDGHAIDGALRRLGLRRSELDLAVRAFKMATTSRRFSRETLNPVASSC